MQNDKIQDGANSEQNIGTETIEKLGNIGKISRLKVCKSLIGLEKLGRMSAQDARRLLVSVLRVLLFTAMGFLFGRVPLLFGTLPLGTALVCAASVDVIPIFCGLVASTFFAADNPVVYIVVYTVSLIIRMLSGYAAAGRSKSSKTEESSLKSEVSGIYRVSGENSRTHKRNFVDRLFCESIYLRMITGCLASFCIGLYAMTAGGFRYYDLFGALFSMTLCPVAVFLYSGYFEEKYRYTRLHEIAVAALFVSLVFSLRDADFYGFSLAAFSAFIFTLFVCRRKGILRGAGVGFLCGLVYSPMSAPMFVLAAIAMGILQSISVTAGVVAACLSALIWSLYIGKFAGFIAVLPSVLGASILFYASDRLSLAALGRELISVKNQSRELSEAQILKRSATRRDAKLEGLAEAFSSLSAVFENLSRRLRKPTTADIKRLCDGVYDKYCPECDQKAVCWEKEYGETVEMIASLSAKLYSDGKAELEVLPEYMRKRCNSSIKIVGAINEACAELAKRSAQSDKTGIVAVDYDAMSVLLGEIIESGKEECIRDEDTAEKISELYARLGYSSHSTLVCGKRRKQILIYGLDISLPASEPGLRDLRRATEEVCGVLLTDPVFEISDGNVSMSMSSRRAFSVACGYSAVPRETEPCGDTVVSFENTDDYFYALISDGMGSGAQAALTSGICSLFMQKMLTAGNSVENSLKMCNALVCAKSNTSECSATVDLLEFDLLNGHASFTKSGAAATYVKRKNSIFKLRAGTLPLGIISSLDARRLNFEAEVGDIICMVSDGVICGGEECPWLLDLLENMAFDPDNLNEAATKITACAVENGSRDDISAVLIMIRGKKNGGSV